MAFSKSVTPREVVVLLDEAGAFASATRIREVIMLEDGEIVAERRLSDPLTKAQLKAAIASL